MTGYPTTTPAAIPLRDAAAHLGISENAVRKRITRGTLQAHKVDGAWSVVVDDYPTATPESAIDQAATTPPATPPDQPPALDQTALVEQLQMENGRLWAELESRREADREQRIIISQLAGRVEALQAGQGAPGSTEPSDQHDDDRRPAWWQFWRS